MSDRDQPLNTTPGPSLAAPSPGPAAVAAAAVPHPSNPAVSVWLGMIIGLMPTGSIAVWAAVTLAVLVRTRLPLLIAAAIASYASRPLADPWLDRFGGWLLGHRGYQSLWLSLMDHPLSLHLQWYNSVTAAVLAAGLIALPFALVADAAGSFLSKRLPEPREQIDAVDPCFVKLDEPPASDSSQLSLPALDADPLRLDNHHQVATPQLSHRRPSRFAFVEAAAATEEDHDDVAIDSVASMPSLGQGEVPSSHLSIISAADDYEPKADSTDAVPFCTERPQLNRKFVVKETIIEILRFHNRRHASSLDPTASPTHDVATDHTAAASVESRADCSGMCDQRPVARDVAAAMNVCSRPQYGNEALPFLLSRLSGVHRGKSPEEA